MWRTHTASIQSLRRLLCQPMLLAVALAGCNAKSPEDAELQWARAALERNPQLKVMAVDAATHSIQVQVKANGETIAVTPGELAAIPIADLVALTQAANAPPPVVSEPAAPAEPEPAPEPPPASEPEVAESTAKTNYDEFVVQREAGRVRVTGPGVSIESHAAPVTEGATQRYDDSIVCDGKRMLRMDARQLNVAGDAITVRGGCELHLSNSRIRATGAAIVVESGTVHISNSEIAGGVNSLRTGPGARAYLRSNTFVGLQVRDSQADIVDQGGNTWR